MQAIRQFAIMFEESFVSFEQLLFASSFLSGDFSIRAFAQVRSREREKKVQENERTKIEEEEE